MKHVREDVKDFSESVRELLSKCRDNGVPAIATFKDYTFSLVDSASQEIAELGLLASGQTPLKSENVILVQQDNSFKFFRNDDSSAANETLDDTDPSFANSNGGKDTEDGRTFSPVTLDSARYLLSLHNVCNNPHLVWLQDTDGGAENAFPDMVVCCDGKDPDHIAVMSCSSANQKARSSGEGKGQRSPGVSVTTVSCFGPVTSKSNLLTVDQVIQQNGGQPHKDNVTTAAFAQYEIVGMTYHETSVLEPGNHSQYTSVTMDCSWELVKGILEKPHSAKCNVHVSAVPGDMRSAAYSVYRELAALVSFVEGLKTEELEWNTKDSSGESVEEAVTRLIEREKEGPYSKPEAQVQTPLESSETDFDSILRGYIIPERQDLYFSESLWNILWSEASCYNDVVKAFSTVFRELKTGELQPIVHSDNLSTLAKAIRASYQQIHTVSAGEVATLTMLVEIGLDKLRRDYTNFFIASELTTLNQLQWYLQSAETYPLPEQVSRLQALHNVLEVAAVSVTSLKLPAEHRRVLVRSALAYYQTHPHDDMHTFTHPVEATVVQSLYSRMLFILGLPCIDSAAKMKPFIWNKKITVNKTLVNFQPSLWRLTVRGGSGTSSSYQLSMKVPLSHLTGLDQDMSLADLTSSGSFCYYVTHTRESTASFM